MNNAPERIFAWVYEEGSTRYHCWRGNVGFGGDETEYVRADLAAQSWQPIETAPRDGTPILAAGPNFGLPSRGYHQSVVEWTQDERTPEQIEAERGCDFSGWYSGDESDGAHEFLTHWMPLHAPPEAK